MSSLSLQARRIPQTWPGWEHLPHNWRRAISLVLGLRVAEGVVAWLSLLVSPVHHLGGDWTALRISPSSAWWPWLEPWQRWDGLWYEHIASNGYVPQGSSAAFFPLYPGLIRLGTPLAGGNVALAALLISTVSCIVALALLDDLVSRDLGVDVGRRTVLYMTIAPTSFFLLAPFSESLFLALIVAGFRATRRQQWGWAAVAGLLAGLCRPAGVLLMVPLGVELINDLRSRSRSTVGRSTMFRLSGVSAVMAPALGLALVMAYTVAVLGVRGGPFGAASLWGQHAAWPWQALADSARVVLGGLHVEEVLNLAAALGLLVAIPLMWNRLPRSYTAYAAVSIPILSCRIAWLTPLMSADRYVLAVFPLFALLAQAGGRRRVHLLVVTLFSMGLLVCVTAFAQGQFIG